MTDEAVPQQSSEACPRCTVPRVGVYRFCPNCGFDYEPAASVELVDFASQFPRPATAEGKPGWGMSLQKRFQHLGVLAGRPLDEIVFWVGPPNAIHHFGNGVVLRQWMQTGYHISLVFDQQGTSGGRRRVTRLGRPPAPVPDSRSRRALA
jgi:hypothetical protein